MRGRGARTQLSVYWLTRVCVYRLGSARCADTLLYDEPPCTDYADLTPPRLARYPADSLPNLVSSPAELFATASGLPLLLTLAVLLLHACCCSLQACCGGGDGADDDDASKGSGEREAVRAAVKSGGEGAAPGKAPRPVEAPLMGAR